MVRLLRVTVAAEENAWQQFQSHNGAIAALTLTQLS